MEKRLFNVIITILNFLNPMLYLMPNELMGIFLLIHKGVRI